MTVLWALNNGYFGHSEFDYLLLNVYSLLSLSLDALVNHVFRAESYSKAHVLAKFTLGLDDKLRWWEEFPLLIKYVFIYIYI